MEQVINSSDYMTANGNKFDILKFVLAILVVAIHATTAGLLFRPILRLAVPLFFIISAFLFFSRQRGCTTRSQRWRGLKKYASRILSLYVFWLLLLSPLTYYFKYRLFNFSLALLVEVVKNFFFGSTFIASWFLMASLIAVAVVWLLSEIKVPHVGILFLGIVCYVVCCLFSNYQGAITAFPSVVEAYNSYRNVFGFPFNSFPVAIIFVIIGKMLACSSYVPRRRLLLVVLLLAMALLYFEFFFTNGSFKVHFDDCYFLLPVVCTCIFMLIGQSRPRKFNFNVKWLRASSTIIYCCHATILRCENSVLNNHGITKPNGLLLLAMFLSTVAMALLLSQLFLYLENRRGFRWLRFAH